MIGNGELEEDAVDFWIGVELFDFGGHLIGRGGGGEAGFG